MAAGYPVNRASPHPYHRGVERDAQTPGPEVPDRGGAAPEAIRVRPTQQGTVYLWTLGLFSVFLLGFQAHLAFLLGSFALGCAGVAWVLARRNLRGLRVRRDAPARTSVGRPTRLRWIVRHPGRGHRVGLDVEDRPARGSQPVRIIAEVPVVEARGEACAEAEVVFTRRGELDLARQPLEIASRYPLGLFRAVGTVPTSGRLLVRPAEGRVTRQLGRTLRGRRPVEARRRFARGEDAIYGVREYRHGDDPRRIHWRTTARRGVATVTQWRTEEGREAVILLGRGSGAGGSASLHFERAVSAAATLWRACVRQRLRVTLDLGDGHPIQSLGDGRGVARGLDALARVPAQGSRKPRKALARLAGPGARRAVFYVSAARERGLVEDLAAAAGRGGSHAVIPAWSKALTRWIRGVGG